MVRRLSGYCGRNEGVPRQACGLKPALLWPHRFVVCQIHVIASVAKSTLYNVPWLSLPYLAQFLAHKKYLAAQTRFGVAGHEFVANATQTTEVGWTALLSGAEDQEDREDDDGESGESAFALLNALKAGDAGLCLIVTVTKEKTKPLPLYTEATLLKDLQRVAKYVKDERIRQLLKDRDAGKAGEHGGIGTPATRAAMLETLQKRGFYTVEKKKLMPTQKGIEFIASLPAIATTPDMTALWHEQQQEIEQGNLSVDQFLDGLETFITEQVGKVNLGAMAESEKQVSGKSSSRLEAKCPKCGNAIAITAKMFACTGCTLKVWAEVAGKTLSENQAESLFAKGKTNLIKGLTSKAGKRFDAKLALNPATDKVEFVFEK